MLATIIFIIITPIVLVKGTSGTKIKDEVKDENNPIKTSYLESEKRIEQENPDRFMPK